MTCLDCIVLVDRMSVLVIYCELFYESQIYLKLPKLQGEWVLAFGAINYGIINFLSHNQ